MSRRLMRESCDIIISNAANRFWESDHLIGLTDTELFAKYESLFPDEGLDPVVEYWPTLGESRTEAGFFMTIKAFWDGTSCQLINSYWRFVGPYNSSLLELKDSEVGGSALLRNVGITSQSTCTITQTTTNKISPQYLYSLQDRHRETGYRSRCND